MTLIICLTFLLGSPECDSHSPVLLDFYISSDASICSTMAFPALGNFSHVAVSVSFDFLYSPKGGAPFHRTAYDYTPADWDCLRDHSRDIFKRDASPAFNEFSVWVQVGIDVYVPYRKHQVKSHSSPWFSAACAAAIAHRNYFFLYVLT